MADIKVGLIDNKKKKKISIDSKKTNSGSITTPAGDAGGSFSTGGNQFEDELAIERTRAEQAGIAKKAQERDDYLKNRNWFEKLLGWDKDQNAFSNIMSALTFGIDWFDTAVTGALSGKPGEALEKRWNKNESHTITDTIANWAGKENFNDWIKDLDGAGKVFSQIAGFGVNMFLSPSNLVTMGLGASAKFGKASSGAVEILDGVATASKNGGQTAAKVVDNLDDLFNVGEALTKTSKEVGQTAKALKAEASALRAAGNIEEAKALTSQAKALSKQTKGLAKSEKLFGDSKNWQYTDHTINSLEFNNVWESIRTTGKLPDKYINNDLFQSIQQYGIKNGFNGVTKKTAEMALHGYARSMDNLGNGRYLLNPTKLAKVTSEINTGRVKLARGVAIAKELGESVLMPGIKGVAKGTKKLSHGLRKLMATDSQVGRMLRQANVGVKNSKISQLLNRSGKLNYESKSAINNVNNTNEQYQAFKNQLQNTNAQLDEFSNYFVNQKNGISDSKMGKNPIGSGTYDSLSKELRKDATHTKNLQKGYDSIDNLLSGKPGEIKNRLNDLSQSNRVQGQEREFAYLKELESQNIKVSELNTKRIEKYAKDNNLTTEQAKKVLIRKNKLEKIKPKFVNDKNYKNLTNVQKENYLHQRIKDLDIKVDSVKAYDEALELISVVKNDPKTFEKLSKLDQNIYRTRIKEMAREIINPLNEAFTSGNDVNSFVNTIGLVLDKDMSKFKSINNLDIQDLTNFVDIAVNNPEKIRNTFVRNYLENNLPEFRQVGFGTNKPLDNFMNQLENNHLTNLNSQSFQTMSNDLKSKFTRNYLNKSLSQRFVPDSNLNSTRIKNLQTISKLANDGHITVADVSKLTDYQQSYMRGVVNSIADIHISTEKQATEWVNKLNDWHKKTMSDFELKYGMQKGFRDIKQRDIYMQEFIENSLDPDMIRAKFIDYEQYNREMNDLFRMGDRNIQNFNHLFETSIGNRINGRKWEMREQLASNYREDAIKSYKKEFDNLSISERKIESKIQSLETERDSLIKKTEASSTSRAKNQFDLKHKSEVKKIKNQMNSVQNKIKLEQSKLKPNANKIGKLQDKRFDLNQELKHLNSKEYKDSLYQTILDSDAINTEVKIEKINDNYEEKISKLNIENTDTQLKYQELKNLTEEDIIVRYLDNGGLQKAQEAFDKKNAYKPLFKSMPLEESTFNKNNFTQREALGRKLFLSEEGQKELKNVIKQIDSLEGQSNGILQRIINNEELSKNDLKLLETSGIDERTLELFTGTSEFSNIKNFDGALADRVGDNYQIPSTLKTLESTENYLLNLNNSGVKEIASLTGLPVHELPALAENSQWFRNIGNIDIMESIAQNGTIFDKTVDRKGLSIIDGVLNKKYTSYGLTTNLMTGIDSVGYDTIANMGEKFDLAYKNFQVQNLFDTGIKSGSIRALNQADTTNFFSTLRQHKGVGIRVEKGFENKGLHLPKDSIVAKGNDFTVMQELIRKTQGTKASDEFINNIVKVIDINRPDLKGASIATKLNEGYLVVPKQFSEIITRTNQLFSREILNQHTGIMKRVYKQVMKMWKGMALLSPGYHIRNIQTNLQNHYLAGVDPVTAFKSTLTARNDIVRWNGMTNAITRKPMNLGKLNMGGLKYQIDNHMMEMLKNTPYSSTAKPVNKFDALDSLFKSGRFNQKDYELSKLMLKLEQKSLLGGMRIKADFNDFLGTQSALARQVLKTKGKASKLKVGANKLYESTLGAMLDMNMRMAQTYDDASRLSMFRLAEQGLVDGGALGFTDAGQISKFYNMDFQNMTAFERKTMRNWIPFYSYARQSIEMHTKNFIANPIRYAIKNNLVRDSRTKYMNKNNESLPEWTVGTNWMPIQLGNKTTFIKTEQPFSNLEQFVNMVGDFSANMNDRDTLSQSRQKSSVNNFFGSVNPMLKIMGDVMYQENSFTGKSNQGLLSSAINDNFGSVFTRIPNMVKEMIETGDPESGKELSDLVGTLSGMYKNIENDSLAKQRISELLRYIRAEIDKSDKSVQSYNRIKDIMFGTHRLKPNSLNLVHSKGIKVKKNKKLKRMNQLDF